MALDLLVTLVAGFLAVALVAGVGGMNTTDNLIGGCLISDERVGIPILHQSSQNLRKC